MVSDLSPARLAQSSVFGADIAVRGDADGKAMREAVMDSTGGLGADIVIEAVGRKETIQHAIDIARPRGQWRLACVVGTPSTALRFRAETSCGPQISFASARPMSPLNPITGTRIAFAPRDFEHERSAAVSGAELNFSAGRCCAAAWVNGASRREQPATRPRNRVREQNLRTQRWSGCC